jgi:hypothetical protein
VASKTARRNLDNARRAAERTAQAAERKAAAGWHELTDALDTATDRTQDVASGAKTRVRDLKRQAAKRTNDITRETGRRTSAAKDALAGRPPKKQRRSTFAAILAGLGIGAAAAVVMRRLNEMRTRADLADLEAKVADTATSTPTPSVVTSTPDATIPVATTPVATTPTVTAPAPRTTAEPDADTTRVNSKPRDVSSKDSTSH